MEKDGQYDPQRIIRLRDYLDNGTIYDEMPEKEKEMASVTGLEIYISGV